MSARAFSLLVLGILWCGAPSAQGQRLNEPFTLAESDVLAFELDARGAHMLFAADAETDGVNELYGGPTDYRHAPRKRNAALTAGGDVTAFALSRDGGLDGSAAAVRLNERLPTNGDVTQWTITPDARHVLYLADSSQDEIFELHLTDFAGNHAVVLDPDLAPGGIVRDFVVSRDGRYVAFRAEALASDQSDLFCAPLHRTAWLAGRRPVARVSGPLVLNGDVRLYEFAGERIVYMADQEVDSKIELYSAPVEGRTPAVKLNQPLPTTGVTLLSVTEDEATVVYRAEKTASVPELFAVPADGSAAPRRVSGALVPDGAVLPNYVVRAGRVYYRADQELDGMIELFSSFLSRPHLPR